MMSGNRYRAIGLGILAVIGLAFALGHIPAYQLDVALGQYGSSSTTFTDLSNVNLHDPRLGDAAPANIGVPQGTRVTFPEGANLYWSPQPNNQIVGLSVAPGETFPVNGISPNTRWLRITILNLSAWVRAEDTPLTQDEIDALLSSS